MMDEALLGVVCCPRCEGDLLPTASSLRCKSCAVTYRVIDGIPVLLDSSAGEWDVDLAKDKWHSFYDSLNWEAQRQEYDSANLTHIYKQLLPLEEDRLFLELGSGPSYLSYDLADRHVKVVCLDFDVDVLRKAKASFDRHGRAGWFVCGNVHRLPFKKGVFDCAAGIGVLEHSADLLRSINEVHRVLKPGGRTFQTVPCLSLLTLVNASLRYGNVPHVPILGPLIRLLHVNLLKTRYMKYGYEESYSRGYLQREFSAGGFSKVEVGFYDHNQVILKRSAGFASGISHHIIKLRPFWDIVCVKAYK
jgi:ubiquinone/menaquinone biosynthesis C-methylase UbiE